MDDGDLRLKDGRIVAYCTAGPPDGLPVLYFHGVGESRYMVDPNADVLDRLGLRLISVDRPGVGRSTHNRRRTILGWADDIADLCTHLGYERFAVVGRSGGAPYVLACAFALPDRVDAATIVSGLGPPTMEMARAVLQSEFWKMALTMRFAPFVVRAGLWLAFRPGGWYFRPRLGRFLDRHISRLPPADQEILKDPAIRDVRLRSMVESLRPGPKGLFTDLSLLARDWGFEPSHIALPVRVWHGEADNIVNVAFGRALSQLLPECRPHFLPDHGHYLIFSHWEQVLSAVREDSLARRAAVTAPVEGAAVGVDRTPR